jgi:tRNA(Ile)-lysidine synthetase-like protein
MKPLGMEGSKKISDVFSEDSIPNLLKPRMPVIESEQGVIGVLPVRRSRLALVNENTKKVLRIEWRFLPEEETN